VSGALTRYDAACRALAEARSVDEVKLIHDEARALAACARIAKNRDLEADAVALRMRATRQLDHMIRAQKESVGLNTGTAGKGRPVLGGFSENPPKTDERPTLASQGIDKNLAHQARVLGKLSDDQFETAIADAHDKVVRAVRNAVREVEILQERESYTATVEQGCTVDDLVALADSGFRASVIYADPPWEFHVYSDKGNQRSAERHYDVSSLDQIKKLPITALAAADCALFLWGVWPELPGALDVIQAWGFDFKTVGFLWVKTTSQAAHIGLNGAGLHWGMGYHTRSNSEPCLLAMRGAPRRLAKDIHQVVIAPVGEHSAKPEEVRGRIERLFAGPYLELFGRKPAPEWTVWGNEIARDQFRIEPVADAPMVVESIAPPAPIDDYLGIPAFLRREAAP
jgi:N6-adenosine-specific RNA methylase IME4